MLQAEIDSVTMVFKMAALAAALAFAALCQGALFTRIPSSQPHTATLQPAPQTLMCIAMMHVATLVNALPVLQVRHQ